MGFRVQLKLNLLQAPRRIREPTDEPLQEFCFGLNCKGGQSLPIHEIKAKGAIQYDSEAWYTPKLTKNSCSALSLL